MVTEHAHLFIDPANAQAFETAFASVAPLIRGAKGCNGMTLEREIEYPDRYRLDIEWDAVADHMDVFRNTAEFQQWAAAVAPFFAGPPAMSHAETVFAA